MSIEDAYKCKRPVSVPGISVNVRRVKVRLIFCLNPNSKQNAIKQPTVKFYGNADQRYITVLEHDTAHLPLRLTGDGVSSRPMPRLAG